MVKSFKPKLNISPAPYVRSGLTLPKMMWGTVMALVFPVLGSIYFFGLNALYLFLTCTISAVLFELFCQFIRRIKIEIDGSAVVTGILLSLILPPSFPLWAAVIGSCFAICVVKHIFGGLGKNIFNPALMGRAFLTAAFPVLITTYAISYRHLPGGMSAAVRQKTVEAITEATTEATPLSKIRFEGERSTAAGRTTADERFESPTYMLHFFLGAKKGSAGETSGMLILLGLAVLLITGVADWRLPVMYFSSVFLCSLVLWIINPSYYINPLLAILLGGVLFGGTYMLTDPVTTPVTPKGKWIFGIGSGILTVVIRNFSGYPEGVMFSILLMNAVTPLINRYTKPRIYGT